MKAAQAPASSGQCPGASCPCSTCEGSPKHSSVLRLPQTPGQSQCPRPCTCRLSFCPFDLGVEAQKTRAGFVSVPKSRPNLPPCPGLACSQAREGTLASLRGTKRSCQSLSSRLLPCRDPDGNILLPTQVHSSQIHPVKTPITLAMLI